MSLLKLPPDTERMRKLFFEMPVPFSVRADVFDRYWMLCDSFWSRYNEITLQDSNNTPYNVIRWFCRLAHREPEKEVKEGETPPLKKRSKKDIHHCTRRIKAFVFRDVQGAPDHYQFEHANAKESDWQHEHTQDDADKHRINSFLKSVVSIEVARGYTPAEAWHNLRAIKLRDVELWNTQDGEQTELALNGAGGKHLTRQHAIDIRNSLRRSSELNRIDRHAEVAWTDTAQIWPVAIGKDLEDYDAHAEIVKLDVAALITSVDLGGRTEVPSRILMPLLNSIAAFMEKQKEAPEKIEEPLVVVEETVVPLQTQPVAQTNQVPSTPTAPPNRPSAPMIAPPKNGTKLTGTPLSDAPPHAIGHPQPPFYPPPGVHPHQHPGPYPPHSNQHPGYPPHPHYPPPYYGPPGPMNRPPPGYSPANPYPPFPNHYGPPKMHPHPPPYPNSHPHPNHAPPPRPLIQGPPLQGPASNSASAAPTKGTPMTLVSTGNEDGSTKQSNDMEIRTDKENRKQKRKRRKKGEADRPIQYRYVFEHCGG